MKKKLVVAMLFTAVTAMMLAGCDTVNVNVNDTGAQIDETDGDAEAADEEVDEDADRKAAQEVADLIDAIYVQEWTEDTD
ncbi:MAG: cobalt chelatase, partial [Lachnospiraceae bacterium]|nr:cobalt chelatase [Lachnospiraceae bacterium]